MKNRTIPNEILLSEVGSQLVQGKKVRLRAIGSSMRPFIREKDSLLLAPPAHLSQLDVVLALTTDGRYVVHRIIAIDKDCYTLRGDGNLYATELCRHSDVMGKVISIIRDERVINPLSRTNRRNARIWHRLIPLRRLAVRLKSQILSE